MSDWVSRLFVEKADLFLKILNRKWAETERLVDGVLRVLSGLGLTSGNLLDLCCGNGRVSIYMARKGFKTIGVDISPVFIEDAKRRATEHGVAGRARFVTGDVRRLKEVLKGVVDEPFDVVVNAWTSLGYYTEEEDYSVFKQARELSKPGAVLLVLDTIHTEYLSLKFTPTSYFEVEDLVVLEKRDYNPLKSRLHVTWTFYRKSGENLEFVDRVDFQLRVYSLGELARLLERAGWRPVASYGDISTLQQASPLTQLNLVARAT